MTTSGVTETVTSVIVTTRRSGRAPSWKLPTDPKPRADRARTGWTESRTWTAQDQPTWRPAPRTVASWSPSTPVDTWDAFATTVPTKRPRADRQSPAPGRRCRRRLNDGPKTLVCRALSRRERAGVHTITGAMPWTPTLPILPTSRTNYAGSKRESSESMRTGRKPRPQLPTSRRGQGAWSSSSARPVR